MREVVVRPDQFMEIWLSAPTGFDWQQGRITIYGRGDAPTAYVGTDDVAELTVVLALAPDPPHRASVMALSLAADLDRTVRTADALRAAGIEPLSLSAYLRRLTST